MKTYLFSYPYQGKQYCLDIPADSLEEAQGRFKAISWGQYDGELVATIPDRREVQRVEGRCES